MGMWYVLKIVLCCSLPIKYILYYMSISDIYINYLHGLLFFFSTFFGKHMFSNYCFGLSHEIYIYTCHCSYIYITLFHWNTLFFFYFFFGKVDIVVVPPEHWSYALLGKKFLSLLCPIVFLLFDRPLTHKIIFQYRLLFG